jgi:undecaprenyl-diphosphatase
LISRLTKRLIERLTLPLLLGLVSAVVSLVLFGALAEEMLEGDTRQFDTTVRLFVHAHSSPPLTAIMEFFTLLGSPLSVSIIAAGSCLALWLKGHTLRSILIAITTIGGSLLMWILKLAFHRHRPEPFFDTRLPASYSFPSGHALMSFCLCGAAAALFAASQKKRWVRIAIWTTASVVAGAIGYSRIYLGVHYPSDVLAGYLGAIVWVSGVGIAYQKWRKDAAPGKSSRNVDAS